MGLIGDGEVHERWGIIWCDVLLIPETYRFKKDAVRASGEQYREWLRYRDRVSGASRPASGRQQDYVKVVPVDMIIRLRDDGLRGGR